MTSDIGIDTTLNRTQANPGPIFLINLDHSLVGWSSGRSHRTYYYGSSSGGGGGPLHPAIIGVLVIFIIVLLIYSCWKCIPEDNGQRRLAPAPPTSSFQQPRTVRSWQSYEENKQKKKGLIAPTMPSPAGGWSRPNGTSAGGQTSNAAEPTAPAMTDAFIIENESGPPPPPTYDQATKS